MKRVWIVALALLLVAGCSKPATGPATATPSTGAPTSSPAASPPAAASASPTTKPTTTTTAAAAVSPQSAVIEPDKVAGLPLGATKAQAIAVLGKPSDQGHTTDLSGADYEALQWHLPNGRGPSAGLVLSFREVDAAGTPRLTDWSTSAPGPRTASGIQFGDPDAKVVSAHGALETFCCESHVASVTRGKGHMVIIVNDATRKVDGIIGGNDGFWSHSIAD